jgi:hypothetical protein
MSGMQLDHHTKEARMMRYIVSIAVVVTCTVLSLISFPAPAQPDSAIERDTLARELAGAWLPLESGLVLSSVQGTPLSAKYELEDGTLQLSVYTLKPDGTFSEVIVDFSAGMITRVDTIAGGGDLVAAPKPESRDGRSEALARRSHRGRAESQSWVPRGERHARPNRRPSDGRGDPPARQRLEGRNRSTRLSRGEWKDTHEDLAVVSAYAVGAASDAPRSSAR